MWKELLLQKVNGCVKIPCKLKLPHLFEPGWGRGAAGKEYVREKTVLDETDRKVPPPKFLVQGRRPEAGLPVNNWQTVTRSKGPFPGWSAISLWAFLRLLLAV